MIDNIQHENISKYAEQKKPCKTNDIIYIMWNFRTSNTNL